jgi:hypothetical protein
MMLMGSQTLHTELLNYRPLNNGGTRVFYLLKIKMNNHISPQIFEHQNGSQHMMLMIQTLPLHTELLTYRPFHMVWYQALLPI